MVVLVDALDEGQSQAQVEYLERGSRDGTISKCHANCIAKLVQLLAQELPTQMKLVAMSRVPEGSDMYLRHLVSTLPQVASLPVAHCIVSEDVAAWVVRLLAARSSCATGRGLQQHSRGDYPGNCPLRARHQVRPRAWLPRVNCSCASQVSTCSVTARLYLR